ncbi:dolichyl-diphosphooligosaccharide--protein glycosyltransferase subunit [Trichophyton mentagrophytes]|nr:dolichyl-diphosphooligosaccharide--protein glycosyltransferase subunit [Trichophyton mentagrophytes]
MDSRFGCDICKMFQPEWELLSRTWSKAKLGDSKVIFGTLDFLDGKGTFQQLKLQTAPIVILLPPSSGPGSENKPARYDFSSPVTAEQMHLWISRHLAGVPTPKLVRPINYTRMIGMLIGMLAVISLITVSSKYVVPILRSRNLWTALSLLAILLFTTGHMFNHIRKVPYVAGDGKGGISYFAGGFQTQFGLESQIIAAIYGVLSLGSIALAMKAPRILDPQSQRVTVILWSAVTWVMYSFLISLFRNILRGCYKHGTLLTPASKTSACLSIKKKYMIEILVFYHFNKLPIAIVQYLCWSGVRKTKVMILKHMLFIEVARATGRSEAFN